MSLNRFFDQIIQMKSKRFFFMCIMKDSIIHYILDGLKFVVINLKRFLNLLLFFWISTIFVVQNNETKMILTLKFLNLQLWQPAADNKRGKPSSDQFHDYSQLMIIKKAL